MLCWNSRGLLGKELRVGRRQGEVTHTPKMGRGRRQGNAGTR